MRILIGLVLLSWAGRPVIHTHTLHDVIAKSNLVLVVEKPQPFRPVEETVREHCKRSVWPFRVKEVLLAQAEFRRPKAPVEMRPSEVRTGAGLLDMAKPGTEIRVYDNAMGLTDCLNRLKNPSGASFYAEQYKPSSPGVLDRQSTLVLFLVVQGGRLHLTMTSSYESAAKRQDVLTAIRQVTGG